MMTQISQQAIHLYLNAFYSALQTDANSPSLLKKKKLISISQLFSHD